MVYEVKINNLQHFKTCIRDAVAMETLNILQATRNNIEYCLVISRVTKGDHIKVTEKVILRKKIITSLCNGATF
jgi:hypothetical protein